MPDVKRTTRRISAMAWLLEVGYVLAGVLGGTGVIGAWTATLILPIWTMTVLMVGISLQARAECQPFLTVFRRTVRVHPEPWPDTGD